MSNRGRPKMDGAVRFIRTFEVINLYKEERPDFAKKEEAIEVVVSKFKKEYPAISLSPTEVRRILRDAHIEVVMDEGGKDLRFLVTKSIDPMTGREINAIGTELTPSYPHPSHWKKD